MTKHSRHNNDISIHAPLAGRDATPPMAAKRQSLFQSTRPSRGATGIGIPAGRGCGTISIHAPLAGRDIFLYTLILKITISIHAPLAGRDPQGAQRE